MKKIAFLSLLVALSLNPLQRLSAQAPKWKHFTGFSVVDDIVASDNFLWLSTTTCILQINLANNTIRKYTGTDGIGYNKSNSSLALGSEGTMYAGGWLNGINYLLPGESRWKNKIAPTQSNYFLALQDFAVDSKGNFWIATGYGRILKVTAGGSITTLLNVGANKVIADKNDNVWFGMITSNGGYLVKFDKQGNQHTYDFSNSGVPNDRINDILVDSANNVWIATEGSGTVRFDGTNWTKYTVGNTLGLVENKYVVVSSGTNERCSHPLLYKFDGSQFALITNTPYDANGSTSEYITTMGSDRNGILYIGSRRNSVSTKSSFPKLLSYDGKSFNEISLTSAIDIPYSATDNAAFDSSGNLWLSSILGGISKYDGNIWKHWDFENESLANANFYTPIAIDRQGVVWSSSSDVNVSASCGGGGMSGE